MLPITFSIQKNLVFNIFVFSRQNHLSTADKLLILQEKVPRSLGLVNQCSEIIVGNTNIRYHDKRYEVFSGGHFIITGAGFSQMGEC